MATALENKKLKRKKLLESGYSLFTDHGIHDVSIQDIVNQAGVAKGTFYLYFKDKYALRDIIIRKVGRDLFSNAINDLENENIQDFEDSVIYLINHVITQLENNKKLLRFIERNLTSAIFTNKIQDVFAEDVYDLEADFNKRAQATGYQIENSHTVLYLIIELACSACYSSIIYETPAPLSEMKPILYKSIRSILKGSKIKKKA